MDNALTALNEHFIYNNRIARTLQEFLPPKDRKIIQVWFDKLLNMNKNVNQMIIRSDYMWFILLMLQNRRLKEPFTQLPPSELLPLKQFVPLNVYDEILILNEPHMIYIEDKSGDEILRLRNTASNFTSCSSKELDRND